MLTTNRDTSGTITRCNDIVDEARERRDAADEEGDDGAPVAGELGRVAVHAVEVVHVGDRHVAAAHDVVVAHQDGCHGAQEDGVAA